MIAIRRLVVSVLMNLCAAVLPDRKSEWLHAMRVEAAHIEGRAVIGFAAGCLLACCKERVTLMSNLPAAARYGIIATMLGYAVFALRSAMHMTVGPGLTAIDLRGRGGNLRPRAGVVHAAGRTGSDRERADPLCIERRSDRVAR
jgi:hypothetical protein